MLAGNDTISTASAITLKGLVRLHEGNDVILTTAGPIDLQGVYEGRSGNAHVSLGGGDDLIESQQRFWASAVELSTGTGADVIEGRGGMHLAPPPDPAMTSSGPARVVWGRLRR